MPAASPPLLVVLLIGGGDAAAGDSPRVNEDVALAGQGHGSPRDSPDCDNLGTCVLPLPFRDDSRYRSTPAGCSPCRWRR